MTPVPCAKQSIEQNEAFYQSRLFKDVQLNEVFPDSKTFVDAIPCQPLPTIEAAYEEKLEVSNGEIDLLAFIQEYFLLPTIEKACSEQNQAENIHQHIEYLWQRLSKHADTDDASSLLPLAHPYIVPGGRFREIYYWDSYFTSLGLLESGRSDLVESMLNNFIDLQARYGRIPNGNRSYYLSRSQPPIMGLMAELLLPFQSDKRRFLLKVIEGISAEYDFWMRGKETLSTSNTALLRTVRMPDGSVLNRYWDENPTPRPESYQEDISLFKESGADNEVDFYRNIRAACESGWDFSSRWLNDSQQLASICTTQIVPVDLNSLLYKQELTLSKFYGLLSEEEQSTHFSLLAEQRKNAIQKYLWSNQCKFYFDYNLKSSTLSDVKSLASVVPLFVKLATPEQASEIASTLKSEFLKVGGLVATVNNSEQQWDSPNGWAPLHWFAAIGLKHYLHDELALSIIHRWMTTVELFFQQSGVIMEKYNVCQRHSLAAGGEYDVQEGFGWTNGVHQAFKSMV